MTISPEKMAQYQATARHRLRLAQDKVAARLALAQIVAQQAATLLKEKYAVARVVIFGSVAHPQLFHAHSDIDLAVWGLAERDYYRAVGELQAIHPAFAIDLIRAEDVSGEMLRTVATENKPL